MVARRLLILLLVLLGISTLAAALAPVKSPNDAKTTETTTTATTPAAPPPKSAGLFKYTIDADSKKLKVVELYVGEELQLTVTSHLLDQISIPELGEVEPVSPDAAAKFDLLLDEAGDYAVRLVDENRLVGRLQVNPGARPEKDRGKANAHRGQQ
jgi:hypothetical protein